MKTPMQEIGEDAQELADLLGTKPLTPKRNEQTQTN
jgi:hypothetical protein